MSKNNLIKFLYLILMASFIISGLRWKDVNRLNVINNNGLVTVSKYSGISVYKVVNDEYLMCNFNTINLIVQNMLNDSYYIISEESDNHDYDVCLSNDTNTVRIIYNRLNSEGRIYTDNSQKINFCLPYITRG